MEIAIERTLKLYVERCINCGCEFGLPVEFRDELKKSHQVFYCPNGHNMIYSAKSEAEKVRDELKRKEAELAAQVEAKIVAQQEAARLERKLKRVHKGTCPCCKRSFENLKRHMEQKHPELANA
jgi:hypothetical protein